MLAAAAAKYGHCQVRFPVEYRPKVPFRPELAAPLDFAVRAAEVYAFDRELDRALLSASDHASIYVDGLAAQPGPAGLFRTDFDPRFRGLGEGRLARPTKEGPAKIGPRRRQFLANQLRFREQIHRFHPPWTLPLVEQAHATLLSGLGLPFPPGELRSTPADVPVGSGGAIYRAAPPERVAVELRSLLDWVDRYGVTLMPVIPATVLIQGFYAIRPFPGGNMTVARALADLYFRLFGLPNASLAPIALMSLDDPVLYRRLQLWTEAYGSHTELIDYSLDATLRAYESAVLRWLGRADDVKPLEEVALRLLVRARRAPGWFSPREAARWVGGRSGPTVLRHLNVLVERGVLESLGRTRAKRYRLVSPLAILPELAERLSVGTAATDVRDDSATPGGTSLRRARRTHAP